MMASVIDTEPSATKRIAARIAICRPAKRSTSSRLSPQERVVDDDAAGLDELEARRVGRDRVTQGAVGRGDAANIAHRQRLRPPRRPPPRGTRRRRPTAGFRRARRLARSAPPARRVPARASPGRSARGERTHAHLRPGGGGRGETARRPSTPSGVNTVPARGTDQRDHLVRAAEARVDRVERLAARRAVLEIDENVGVVDDTLGRGEGRRRSRRHPRARMRKRRRWMTRA